MPLSNTPTLPKNRYLKRNLKRSNSSLHRNNGDGTFEQLDFPQLPTVNSIGAVLIDINNDGLIDLYFSGY